MSMGERRGGALRVTVRPGQLRHVKDVKESRLESKPEVVLVQQYQTLSSRGVRQYRRRSHLTVGGMVDGEDVKHILDPVRC